jgi:dTDP-4-dehydrorhamnose reductase
MNDCPPLMTQSILLTGLNGMLGQQLQMVLPRHGYTLVGASSATFNVLETIEALDQKLTAMGPLHAIVHAAALTRVDEAETNPELAMAVNKEGTHKMALLAKRHNLPLVYISTDYVFDGQQRTPYTPQDKPNPINVYGWSKYYGEVLVTELLEQYVILRTSWVYGHHKPNFVQQVLAAAQSGQHMGVFTDQVGSPTWTGSLAVTIAQALKAKVWGTFHASDRGAVSRFEQAQAICAMAGLGTQHLKPVTTASLNLPALRPAYSVLDPCTLPMPDWQHSLQNYLSVTSHAGAT